MSSCSVDNKCCCCEFVKQHDLGKYVNFLYRALVLEQPVHYACIVLFCLVQFYLFNFIGFTLLTNIILFTLEMYWVNIALNALNLLNSTEEEQKEAMEFMSGPVRACQADPLAENETVKKWREAKWYAPLMFVIKMLILAFLANFFNGPKTFFFLMVLFLVIPFYVKLGLHAKVMEFYNTKIYPSIKPFYEQNIKPQLDKLQGKVKAAAEGAAPATTPATAPATAPADQNAQPAANAAPEQTVAEGSNIAADAAPAEAPAATDAPATTDAPAESAPAADENKEHTE